MSNLSQTLNLNTDPNSTQDIMSMFNDITKQIDLVTIKGRLDSLEKRVTALEQNEKTKIFDNKVQLDKKLRNYAIDYRNATDRRDKLIDYNKNLTKIIGSLENNIKKSTSDQQQYQDKLNSEQNDLLKVQYTSYLDKTTKDLNNFTKELELNKSKQIEALTQINLVTQSISKIESNIKQ